MRKTKTVVERHGGDGQRDGSKAILLHKCTTISNSLSKAGYQNTEIYCCEPTEECDHPEHVKQHLVEGSTKEVVFKAPGTAVD
jgi:hypothetical protein